MKKMPFLPMMGLLAAMAFSPPVSARADVGNNTKLSSADDVQVQAVTADEVVPAMEFTLSDYNANIAQESAPPCNDHSAVGSVTTLNRYLCSIGSPASVNGTQYYCNTNMSISGTSMAVRSTNGGSRHHSLAIIDSSAIMASSVSIGDKISAHPGGDLRLQG